MGNTFFFPSLLRRSALRAVQRSGECDSTHRGAEPPAGRGTTSALARHWWMRPLPDLFAVGTSNGSSASSILGWSHCTHICFPEFSNQQLPKIRHPFLSARLQTHGIPNEGFPHKSLSSLPLDLPVAPHPPHQPSPRIFHVALPRAPNLWMVMLAGSFLPQRFVRPKLVVHLYPPIGPSLLRPPVARGRPSQLCLQHSMHLFVPSILFGMAWRDEFHRNPQCCPPSAQSRKTRWASRSKRSAVVHADDPRVTVASKQSQKDSSHRLPPLIGQQSDTQQVAAVQVPHCQRFDPLPILCSKPPFEIHRPYVVASASSSQLPKAHLWSAPSPSTKTAAEFHPLEPTANRAHCRNLLPFVFLEQSSSQFASSPAAMPPPHPPNPLQPFLARSPGRALRTARPIQQSGPTMLFESMLPFVAAFAADAKQPTQLRHASLGLQGQLHELQASGELSKGLQ